MAKKKGKIVFPEEVYGFVSGDYDFGCNGESIGLNVNKGEAVRYSNKKDEVGGASLIAIYTLEKVVWAVPKFKEQEVPNGVESDTEDD